MDPDLKVLLKAWLWLAWLLVIAWAVTNYGVRPVQNITRTQARPECVEGEVEATMRTGAIVCIRIDELQP